MHHDIYSASNLENMLPPWAVEGGEKKILERLKDKEIRRTLKRDMPNFIGPGMSGLVADGRYDLLIVQSSPKHRELEERSLAEIAKIRGVDHPLDAAFDLFIENDGSLSFKSQILRMEDIDPIFLRPY